MTSWRTYLYSLPSRKIEILSWCCTNLSSQPQLVFNFGISATFISKTNSWILLRQLCLLSKHSYQFLPSVQPNLEPRQIINSSSSYSTTGRSSTPAASHRHQRSPSPSPPPAGSTGLTETRPRSISIPAPGRKTNWPTGRNVCFTCRFLILSSVSQGHPLLQEFSGRLQSISFCFSSSRILLQLWSGNLRQFSLVSNHG